MENNLIYLFITLSQTGSDQKDSSSWELSRMYLRVGAMARDLGSLILKVLTQYLRERNGPPPTEFFK